MSRWYCEILGQELGPLSFNELVEIVRAGILAETDRVRRESVDGTLPVRWENAESVVGLFRAARLATDQPHGVANRRATADSEQHKPCAAEHSRSRPGQTGAGSQAAEALLARLQNDSSQDFNEIAGASRQGEEQGWGGGKRGIAASNQIASSVVCVLLAGLIVYGIDLCFQQDTLRFPMPIAVRARETGFRFWGWESLSAVEFTLVWFDAVVLGGVLLNCAMHATVRNRSDRA